VEEIRRTFVPDPKLSGVTNHAKYLSRLGLFFTSDEEITKLERTDYEEIPDIFSKKEQCLTDGAGYIRESFFKEIYPLKNMSALQIRGVGGNKGILVVLPDSNKMFDDRPVINVLYRPSMLKVASPHSSLDIVAEADLQSLVTNKEMINLLTSHCYTAEGENGGQWSPNSSLLKHLDDELDRLSEMLTDPQVAKYHLKCFIDNKFIDYVDDAQIDMLSDPFWLNTLRSLYTMKSRHLRIKTHIPIPRGCFVMGIPDYTQELGENQIFLRLKRSKDSVTNSKIYFEQFKIEEYQDGYEYVTVLGDVAVYRNPCLYPGDIRILQAVKIESLYHSTNVIVFPSSDSINQSIPFACSGGDLDGDKFSVIWDPELIPPKERQFEALDYAKVSEDAKKNIDSNKGININITDSI
jgi:RNA-dependent RNA polymerase